MVSFTPAISRKSAKHIRQIMRYWHLTRYQDLDVNALSKSMWPRVQGWINYYGRFGIGELRRVLFHLDEHIMRWAQRKYKKLRRRSRVIRWLHRVRKTQPSLFAHWRLQIETVGR